MDDVNNAATARREAIPLSALQHVAYCERQFALIHIEGVWVENRHTARGHTIHERAHTGVTEVRGTMVSAFGVEVSSRRLGVAGKTDRVDTEYTDRAFTSIQSVTPVEYKSGRWKLMDYDRIQLCAQAVALEEMMSVSIAEAQIYYYKTRSTESVALNRNLRDATAAAAERAHELIAEGHTPPAYYAKAKCASCSLFDICKPRSAGGGRSARTYIQRQLLRESH